MAQYTVEIKNITGPTDKLERKETLVQTIAAEDIDAAKKKAMRNLFGLSSCILDQRNSDGSEYVQLLGDGRNRSGAQTLYGKIYIYAEEASNA
jgi:hypothetical protein